MTDTQDPNSVEGAGGQASGDAEDLLNQQPPGEDQNPASGDEGAGGQTGAEGKGETGGKEGDDGNQESEAPEEYGEFTLPDGMELNEQLLAQANPVFKELGLSQEQAQKLVDFESTRQQAQVDQFHQQIQTWQQEVSNDPEIGGEKMDESIALANKAIGEYFEPGFMDVLRSYGLTNNPEVIRGLKRIGERHLTEDNPGGGRAPHREKSRAEKLYGTE